jgi:hypothetical protein
MGRRRAPFPDGIAEEEQRYAQVLRDIRDLGGENQQALGRLLGWSVSTLSRFEAATERPDQATHRRYCALAQQMSCASGRWPPMTPCRRHQHGMSRQSEDRPRTGRAAPWTVLGSTSSSRPRTLPIRRCGCSATRPSPCRCGRNRHRASSGRRRGLARRPRPLQSSSRRAPVALLGAVRPTGRAGVRAAPGRLGPLAIYRRREARLLSDMLKHGSAALLYTGQLSAVVDTSQ